MKQMLLLVALCAPVWIWGQNPVSVGGYAGMFDCNMDGKFTESKSRSAFGGSLWAEWNVKEWLGLKSELSYMPRGGQIEGVELEANYLALSVTPRFHLADGSSPAHLVAGVGVFTHLMALGDKDQALNTGDVGACIELGVEWRLFSILAKGQIGFLDVIPGLDKSQRWGAFGLGIEVPFLRR